MYNVLLTSLEDHLFTITINRPEKLNALNREVLDELASVIDEVYTNKEIKGVILTGAGAKAFVAGADISEFSTRQSEEGKALAQKGQDIFSRIEQCPKPFVAAVNGFALGGGCELAMSCHFRYASENARFGQPEVNLGLIPGYGGTQRLPMLVGKGKAIQWIMTGEIIDATQALNSGLVNAIVPQENLISEVRKVLSTIISKSPLALEKVIAAVNAYYDRNLDGFAEEIHLFGECFGTEDMKEGVAAFLEKRKPVFSGK
ncbi:enoyl-CoA hydratase/isomerase family protein [Pollutibacter soli]|uniref:enoyl-CoA hydratase/isomerase family protein n=1 Tax=Pollutibacter soli TaxID=3034157 RepID=UPI0030140A67